MGIRFLLPALLINALSFFVIDDASAQRKIEWYEPDYNLQCAQHNALSVFLTHENVPAIYAQFYSSSATTKKIKSIERVTLPNDNNDKRYLIETFDENGFITGKIAYDLSNKGDTHNAYVESYRYDPQRLVITLNHDDVGSNKYYKEYLKKTFYFNNNKLLDSIRIDMTCENCYSYSSVIAYQYDELGRIIMISYTGDDIQTKRYVKYKIGKYSKSELSSLLTSSPTWRGERGHYRNFHKRVLSYKKMYDVQTIIDSITEVKLICINQDNIFYFQDFNAIDNNISHVIGGQIAHLYKWGKDDKYRVIEIIFFTPAFNEGYYIKAKRNLFGELRITKSLGPRAPRKIIYSDELLREVNFKQYTQYYYYKKITDK